MKKLMRWMAALTACAGVVGCSVIRQSATTEGSGTNLVRHTTLTVKTLGDAKQVVESLKASNGSTHTLGAAGVQQESTSQLVTDLFSVALQAARMSAAPVPTVPALPIPSAAKPMQSGPPGAALAVPAAPNPHSKR
jgi:hypothetical protein